jgi:hypothetical protein
MVTPNFDTMLHRLTERQTERADATICDNCGAGLTETDRELGFCTQCKSSIESDDEDLSGE